MWWIIGIGLLVIGFLWMISEFVNAPIRNNDFTNLQIWEYDDDEHEDAA